MNAPTPFERQRLFWNRAETILRALLLAGPAWFLGAVAFITASRFSYPFELEWLEGGSLIQVLRLLDGKALYVKPALEYVAYIYPPLYYYLSALLARIIGQAWFTPLRIVSLASSLGVLLLIYVIVRRNSASRYWGLISAGFFAATFQIGGAWFDIARVDMLFIFLLLGATCCLEIGTPLALLAAGILSTGAFFTKQTALPVLLVILVYLLLFRNRKAALLAGGFFAASSILWAWIETVRSGGWYWYYVFELPSLHSLPPPGLAYFAWPIIILAPVSIAFTFGIVRFLLSPKTTLQGSRGIWMAFALGALGTSIVGALNPGSFNNTYIPAYAGIAVLFGIEAPGIIALFVIPGLRFLRALVYLACIVQFLTLVYNVPGQIPTGRDLKAAQELVVVLANFDGPILIPNHNYLALLAGKTPYAHQIALQEIRGNFGKPDRQWDALSSEIKSDLENRKFSVIVLDQPSPIWQDVPRYYTENAIPYSSPDVFWPVTGGQTRPQFLYRPAH